MQKNLRFQEMKWNIKKKYLKFIESWDEGRVSVRKKKSAIFSIYLLIFLVGGWEYLPWKFNWLINILS